jgi:hypothetical protein
MAYHRSRKTIIARNGGVGVRKLVKIGNGIAVFIPKEFLRARNLSAGEEIALKWNGDLSLQPLKGTD